MQGDLAKPHVCTRKSNTWLLDWRSDVFSQCGEDGIISKILETLPANDNWCVEFGAWDGEHCSTTCNLIRNRNYSAVLIEANTERFQQLKRNHEGRNVTAINAFVGFNSNDGLDVLLRKTPIPLDFDFLSIDIDGNDYHVWDALSDYSPKVVCVEFNPTIPSEVTFIQARDSSVQQGSSVSAFVELGKAKGYELVSVLPWNALFVKAEYFDLFDISDNNLSTLRTNLDDITHFFIGYDGSIHATGNLKFPWHNVQFDESMLQLLPRSLQRFPGHYSRFERWLLRWNLWFLSARRKPIPPFKQRTAQKQVSI